MGVWSLLQYFEKCTPDAVRRVRPYDLAGDVGPFDVVYVDANSVLHGGDLSRLVTLMRVLKPQKAFVLCADFSPDGKPGKYLNACRYFAASCEYVRGKKHEEDQVGEITDQEDYTSPLMLPQAEPNPFLRMALAEAGRDCMITCVARDVKGPADTKISSLVAMSSSSNPDATHCIVSRDNDLVLTAMSSWRPADPGAATPPPAVLTWDDQDWEASDALCLLDTSLALPKMISSPFVPTPSTASTPIPALFSALGRDFSLLTFLTLGCDHLTGVFGGSHYTHVHSLLQKYTSGFLTPNAATAHEGVVVRLRTAEKPANDDDDSSSSSSGDEDDDSGVARGVKATYPYTYPTVDLDTFVRLLQKLGAGREEELLGDEHRKLGATRAKRYIIALWASLASVVCGRAVRSAERYGVGDASQQVTLHAATLLSYLQNPSHRAEAEAILSGEHFAAADMKRLHGAAGAQCVLELYSTDKANRHLHGQGEKLEASKLPARNQKCEGLPPLSSQKFDIFRVRLYAGDSLVPFLRQTSAAATTPQKEKRATAKARTSLAPAPRLFKGFGAAAAKPAAKRAAAAAAKEKRAATSQSIQEAMLQNMGMGGLKALPNKEKLLLGRAAEERRLQKTVKATMKRKRQDQEAGGGDSGAPPAAKKAKKAPLSAKAKKGAEQAEKQVCFSCTHIQ